MASRTDLFESMPPVADRQRSAPASNLQGIGNHQRLTRRWRTATQCTVVALGDLAAFLLAASLALSLALQSGKMSVPDFYSPAQQLRMGLYFGLALFWVLWFGVVKQSCINRRPFWAELQQMLLALLGLGLLDLALVSISRAEFSRTWWAVAWLSLSILLPGARRVSRMLLQSVDLWSRPTVIFGCGENARQAYLAMCSEPIMGFNVRAFLDPRRSAQVRVSDILSPCAGIPLLPWVGSEDEVNLLRSYHCVIAVEADQWETRDALIRELTRNRIVDVHVIPAMRGVPLYGLETAQFFSHEVLLIQLRNNLASGLYRTLKRTFDIVVSSALLALLSPLLAYVALKISKDGGPPIFGHTRIGRDGKAFKCLKFRSMVVNAQEILSKLLATDPEAKAEWDKDFKLKNDPRINEIGHFLRKTSLDELPQLWNVLKGEMSLVGPRPIVQDELSRYGDDVAYYLLARPGMTGLWQVSGRNNVDYATRVYLDSWYVKNWSLWSDIAILFKTVGVVTDRSGAY